MLEQQLLNALTLGSVYALFALGFTLVFGVLAVINLSHGAVFMVGSYVALALITHLQASLWVAMLGAMLASGIVGLLVDMLILKPLRARNAPHLIPMIATIGVGIMLTSAAQGLFGAEVLRFPEETLPAGEFVIGDVHVRALEIAIVAIAFLLMAVLFVALKRTQLGRALRAIAESPKAAWLLGINVEGLFHITSFAAAALGGIAGVLIGLNFNAITPFMGQPMLHKGIAVIILGGMGDIRGALIGGLFLGFAEVISKAYLSSQMGDAVAFGLLFLILLVRPSGLFGRKLERKA
ncbi:branched-chain amino acid ABC transporter permease [Oryzomicrobium sp.]|uniref:branched-chain amino acid ABC transporter permease n=1 Tax=Oryzomicrobium sp. TaxID=1911578 RepID=UPI0025FF5631|nr:branched-chain amino acid ABC transporter permease [Oryzomicrobium sp.]MCE1243016.1 branched-chain amino acid ABC transporter permease [Oryzomicrobium sp.]